MTAAQYSAALGQIGITQVEAAAFLDISIRTAHAYANDRHIPRAVQLLLELMVDMDLKPEDLT